MEKRARQIAGRPSKKWTTFASAILQCIHFISHEKLRAESLDLTYSSYIFDIVLTGSL